jgi:hypothetical protein
VRAGAPGGVLGASAEVSAQNRLPVVVLLHALVLFCILASLPFETAIFLQSHQLTH